MFFFVFRCWGFGSKNSRVQGFGVLTSVLGPSNSRFGGFKDIREFRFWGVWLFASDPKLRQSRGCSGVLDDGLPEPQNYPKP